VAEVDSTAKSQTATTVTPTVNSSLGTTINFPPPPSYSPKASQTPTWYYVLGGIAALFAILGVVFRLTEKK
jgi:hypothetical protein